MSQRFNPGDVVRRTGRALKSMGLIGDYRNGLVTGYDGRFPLVIWSDNPEEPPTATAEAGLELDPLVREATPCDG